MTRGSRALLLAKNIRKAIKENKGIDPIEYFVHNIGTLFKYESKHMLNVKVRV